MTRDEVIGEILKIQGIIEKMINHLEVSEDELHDRNKMSDALKILNAMVRNRVDIFELDLVTASDIADAISLSHKLCPDLLRSIGVSINQRKMTPVQAGMLTKKLPFAKKYLVAKGKHAIRVWSLKGDYMKFQTLSSTQMCEHYQAQMDEFISKVSNSKEKLAANPPPDDEIDPPNFL